MSWVRVWVHLVFSTKNRIPYLNSLELRKLVFHHLSENAIQKDIFLEAANGYQEHVHCLISLNKLHSISQTAQLIKGESSYWINTNRLTKGKFSWQDDYWAVGVSESHVDAVKNYIHQQESHHQKIPFSKEVDDFMEKYGWEYIKG